MKLKLLFNTCALSLLVLSQSANAVPCPNLTPVQASQIVNAKLHNNNYRHNNQWRVDFNPNPPLGNGNFVSHQVHQINPLSDDHNNNNNGTTHHCSYNLTYDHPNDHVLQLTLIARSQNGVIQQYPNPQNPNIINPNHQVIQNPGVGHVEN